MGYMTVYTNPQQIVKIISHLVYDIESIFSTTSYEEESKVKPYVTTVNRYMWYVF